MLKGIGRVVAAGIVAAIGIVVYKYVLTPQAKDSIKDVAKKGVQFGLDVHETITGRKEKEEEDRVRANQQFVASEWEKAGF